MTVVTVFTMPAWECELITDGHEFGLLAPLEGDDDLPRCGEVLYDAHDRGNNDTIFRAHLVAHHGLPSELVDPENDLDMYGKLVRLIVSRR